MQDFMDKGARPPTTAAPSVLEFSNLYNDLLTHGAKEIGSVHMMSTKSGTYSNATVAAEAVMKAHKDVKIRAIDAKSFSLAELLQVKTAIELQNNGAPLEEIDRILTRDADKNMSVYVAINSLKNLAASGRVSKGKEWATSLLNIKVIVHLIDNDLESYQLIHGGKAARRMIVQDLMDDVETRKAPPSKIGVIYTYNPEIGDELVDMLGGVLRKPGEPTDSEHPRAELVGPVDALGLMAIHSGPNAGAVAAVWKDVDPQA
jgi:DegV family protein with EDD domain